MSILISRPTGNRNVKAVLKGLDSAEMLSEFHTTIAADQSDVWLKMMPEKIQKELMRRNFPVNKSLIRTHAFYELARMLFPKIGLKSLVKGEGSFAGIDAVYRNLDRDTARRLRINRFRSKVAAVYAYEDGALETFKRAREFGLKCIYELPIAYWQLTRKLLHEEAQRLPEWAATLGGGILDSAAKLERKTRELDLADLVITPSSFVQSSLPEWAAAKPKVLAHFGSPETQFEQDNTRDDFNSKRKLRVLFAGSMGQRKGLGDLFAAFRLLDTKEIELVVLGSELAPAQFYRSEYPRFIYEPVRPQKEVLQLMRSCDVFCLPSIIEGRALVMQEAMSQGLPLIITANTGGEDLIIKNETGFLVPIRSPQKIAESIDWFASNRKELPAMRKSAMEHAATYTWIRYGERISEAIKKLL